MNARAMTRRDRNTIIMLLALVVIFTAVGVLPAQVPERPAPEIVCRIKSGDAWVTEYVEPGEVIRFAPGVRISDEGLALPALYEIAEPGTSRHFLGQWSLVECRSLP